MYGKGNQRNIKKANPNKDDHLFKSTKKEKSRFQGSMPNIIDRPRKIRKKRSHMVELLDSSCIHDILTE